MTYCSISSPPMNPWGKESGGEDERKRRRRGKRLSKKNTGNLLTNRKK